MLRELALQQGLWASGYTFSAPEDPALAAMGAVVWDDADPEILPWLPRIAETADLLYVFVRGGVEVPWPDVLADGARRLAAGEIGDYERTCGCLGYYTVRDAVALSGWTCDATSPDSHPRPDCPMCGGSGTIAMDRGAWAMYGRT